MYDYLLLMTASWLAYCGAPAVVIVIVATLLSVPRFVRDQSAQELSLATAVATANALMFSALAYGIGVGVANLLGS